MDCLAESYCQAFLEERGGFCCFCSRASAFCLLEIVFLSSAAVLCPLPFQLPVVQDSCLVLLLLLLVLGVPNAARWPGGGGGLGLSIARRGGEHT